MDKTNIQETTGLAAAIKMIQELSERAAGVERITVGDREYLVGRNFDGSPSAIQLVEQDNLPKPETVSVNTLEAFVTYIRAGIENGEINDLLYINVIDALNVEAFTPVNKYGHRSVIVTTRRTSFREFSFGSIYSFEDFVVALRSKFVATETQKKLLGCLKQVTSSNEIKTEDNGITQVVTAKAGAALGSVEVPPIWSLRPFRTFAEVEQPESLFLLRLRTGGDGVAYTLHETDGGAWQVNAIKNIRTYMKIIFSGEAYQGKVFVL